MDGSECTIDRPFCTPVGCMYECPAPFYINGSWCVVDCGEMLVHEATRTCVQSCPEGTFTNNITGRVCVSTCPSGYYKYGSECLSDCGKMLVHEATETCVQSCPEGTFTNNITGRVCVSTCPSGYYKYDSECWLDCADRVVYNNECLQQCPDGFFIRETLELIQKRPYLERMCIVCRSYGLFGDFVFNNTCVRMCPVGARYLDAKYFRHPVQYCLSKCPHGNDLKMNQTVSNVTYFTCQDSCLQGQFVYEEDGFCTDQCSLGKVLANNSCVTKCPATLPVLLGGVCNENCESAVDTSTTCMCPLNRPFLYNRSCLSTCPVNASLLSVVSGVKHCSNSCLDGQYMADKTCVDICPDDGFLYANQCVPACPQAMPFSCRAEKGQHCSEKLIQGSTVWKNVCIANCPESMFADGNHCTVQCPKYAVQTSRSCVEECPGSDPFVVNITEGLSHQSWSDYYGSVKTELLCVEKCPYNKLLLSTNCTDFCPEHYKEFNNTCVYECPYDTLIIKKDFAFYTYSKTYFNDKWRRTRTSVSGESCVSTCKVNQVVFNSSCTDRCPDTHRYNTDGVCSDQPCNGTNPYMYNSTSYIKCTNSCASDMPFVYNNVCTGSCPTGLAVNKHCVSECPEDYPLLKKDQRENNMNCFASCNVGQFLLNSTCLDLCPHTYLLFNQSCVVKCPLSYPYKQPKVVKKQQLMECVEHCSSPVYALSIVSNECVKQCPDERQYITDSTCVASCPENSLTYHEKDFAGELCVESGSCPNKTYQYNATCIPLCPNHFYNNNGICVTKCPPERPWGLEKDTRDCIHYCDGHDLFLDGQCVGSYMCNKTTAVYNGACLSKCPSGFYYGITNGNNACTHFKVPLVSAAVLLGLFIIIVVYSRKVLKDYLKIIYTCIKGVRF